jgi:hypothetical protein
MKSFCEGSVLHYFMLVFFGLMEGTRESHSEYSGYQGVLTLHNNKVL